MTTIQRKDSILTYYGNWIGYGPSWYSCLALHCTALHGSLYEEYGDIGTPILKTIELCLYDRKKVNVLGFSSLRDLLATLFISVAVCTSKTFDLANDNNVILLAISPYGHSGMTFLVSKQSKALRCLRKKTTTFVFLNNISFIISIWRCFWYTSQEKNTLSLTGPTLDVSVVDLWANLAPTGILDLRLLKAWR